MTTLLDLPSWINDDSMNPLFHISVHRERRQAIRAKKAKVVLELSLSDVDDKASKTKAKPKESLKDTVKKLSPTQLAKLKKELGL